MKKYDIHNYEDIFSMAHPVSKKHPPMQKLNRAAQFAPFAALTGHKEAIQETQRLTEEKRVLDENQKAILDEQLQIILSHIKLHPMLQVTYFEHDHKKMGGTYQTIHKKIKSIDEVYRTLLFMDSTRLNIDEIYDIEMIVDEDVL